MYNINVLIINPEILHFPLLNKQAVITRRTLFEARRVAASGKYKQRKNSMTLCYPLRSVCLFSFLSHGNKVSLSIYFVKAGIKSVDKHLSLLIKISCPNYIVYL